MLVSSSDAALCCRLEAVDHLSEAKRLKHAADQLDDRLAKSLMYVEAVLSFIRCGHGMESQKVSEPNKIYSMYQDTLNLLR